MYFIRERERERRLLNHLKTRARICAKYNHLHLIFKEKLSYFKVAFGVYFLQVFTPLNTVKCATICVKNPNNLIFRTALAPSPCGEVGGRGLSSSYRKLRCACIQLLTFRTSRCFTPISPEGYLAYLRFSDFARKQKVPFRGYRGDFLLLNS